MARRARRAARRARPVAVARENPIGRFVKETRSEIRKVTWPTRQEATNMTAIVIAVTLTMAAGLGVLDYVFTQVFRLLVALGN